MKKNLEDFRKKLNIDLLGLVGPESLDLARERILENKSLGLTTDFELDNINLRVDPSSRLEGVKSIFVLGMSYFWDSLNLGAFKISRYARGRDYHLVLREKIEDLVEILEEDYDFSYYSQVDSGGFYEKDLGRLAGFGSYGKHSLLINEDLGSYFFLGILFTTIPLEEFSYDPKISEKFCGSCTICQRACPTGAILGDYRVDFNKCLSYVSQSKSDSPYLKDLTYAYGCDICQEVCPKNKKILKNIHEDFRPRMENFDQVDLALMSNKGFKREFKDFAFSWVGRKVILRNIEIIKSRG